MQFVRKWVESPQGRAVARFLVEEEDSFYGEDLSGFNLGPGTLAFGAEFEDPNAWLRFLGGGLHYFKDGVDQGELGGGGGGGTFIALSDTPADYVGATGQILAVNAGETALEFFPFPQFPTTFTGLFDTPTSYAGEAGAFIRVNPAEDGLVFEEPEIGVLTFPYKFEDTVAVGDPGSGKVAVNNADPTLATIMSASNLDRFGNPRETFAYLQEGDVVVIADTNSVDVYSYVVTGPVVDNVDHDEIPISNVNVRGSIGDNENVNLTVLFLGAHNFIDLNDTPDIYGDPGQVVVMNGTGDALIYATLTAGATGYIYSYVASILLDPVAGEVQFDNADPTLAANCAMNQTDSGGNFVGSYFSLIQLDDYVLLAGATATEGIAFIADGPAVLAGGIYTIPIQAATLVISGGATVGTDFRFSLFRPSGGVVNWDDILGKPATFPPDAHTHPFTEITSVIADAQVPETAVTQHQAALAIGWAQLTGVPATFPPAAHTHPFTDITGANANAQVVVGNVTQHQAALSITYSQISDPPAAGVSADAWCYCVAPGTVITRSFNVASIVNNSPGNHTITYTTPMANATYAACGNANHPTASGTGWAVGAILAASCQVESSVGGPPADMGWSVAIFGGN